MYNGFLNFRDGEVPRYNCGDGATLRIYEGISREECEEYREKLEKQGFRVLHRNENYGNAFISLAKDFTVNLYFTPADGVLRVTTAPNDPTFPYYEGGMIQTDGGTRLYFFENDHTLIDCGMCIIIQCPDNSFFIVDSGHYFQMNDNDRIYKFMRQRTPQGEKIRINGWFVTHTHTDHISKMVDFLEYNCQDVDLGDIYVNLLPEDYIIEDWGREEQGFNRKFRAILGKMPPEKVHKLHSGQCFKSGNLVFDVLCTHEDIFPTPIEDFNDSSTVLMMTVGDTRVFIPGDASGLSSAVLEKRYGEKLKCDIVQIAHHGHFGLSEKMYENLGGKVAVFPITRIKFDEELPRLSANRKAIEIADKYYITSDGTVEIPLPYKDGQINVLPDETFEDFEKIKRLWGYTYTVEYKTELYRMFCQNGGNLENILLPVDKNGAFLD